MAGYLIVMTAVAVVAAVRGVWSPCGLSMISAINPFTEHSRGNRYGLTSAWFIAGSVLGGALLGGVAALGALAWRVLDRPLADSAAVAALCCLIAVASDSPVVRFQLPTHPRQVNERWLGQYRRWVYAAGFGAQIGSGFATYIMTAAVYLTAALGVLSGSPAIAIGVGLLFGSVRGAAVLLSSAARDPAALRRLHRRLDRLAPWSLRAAVLVESIAGVVLAGLAFGSAGAAVGSTHPVGRLPGVVPSVGCRSPGGFRDTAAGADALADGAGGRRRSGARRLRGSGSGRDRRRATTGSGHRFLDSGQPSRTSAAGSTVPPLIDCVGGALPTLQSGTMTIGTGSPATDPWFVAGAPSSGEGLESSVGYALAASLVTTVIRSSGPRRPAAGPRRAATGFDLDLNQFTAPDPARRPLTTRRGTSRSPTLS